MTSPTKSSVTTGVSTLLIISGVNIKVAGDDETNGVFLTKTDGDPTPVRALIHNNPSQGFYIVLLSDGTRTKVLIN